MISPSKLNTFIECPYKYFLIYVKNVKPIHKLSYDFGSKIHSIISRYYQLIPDSIVPGEIPSYLSKAAKEYGELDSATEIYLRNFVRFEENRLSWNISSKPVAIEKRYVKDSFEGTVDAVFRRGNEYVIVDWKTGFHSDVYNEKIAIQGMIYLYITGASRVYFVYLRTGEVFEVKFDYGFLNPYLEKFKQASYSRVEGEHCKTCEVSLHCYVDKWGLTPWDL